MISPQQNLVGPQVRRLRMAAGLSQEAMAGKLQRSGWDISRGGVSKIEARLRLVNDGELYLMAKTLGCELNDLYPARITDLARVIRQGYS